MSSDSDLTPITRLELKRAEASELVLADEQLRKCLLVEALGEGAQGVLRQGIARRFPDKVSVFRQGDDGDALFLVLRGEARIFAQSGEETLEVCAALKGDVFGEEELLRGQGPRSTTAVASGELDLVELPSALLAGLRADRPALVAYLEAVRERRRMALDELAAFLLRW